MKQRASFARSLGSNRLALTLLELIVSLGISSILVVGMTSALFVAVKAMDPPEGLISAQTIPLRAIQPLLSELHFATSLTEYSERSLTFTLADRDGDAVPETLHYEWGGNSGDPLLAQVNNNKPFIVLPDVGKLNFSYQADNSLDDQGVARTQMVSVGIALQTTQGEAGLLETAVLLLNRPEVPSE